MEPVERIAFAAAPLSLSLNSHRSSTYAAYNLQPTASSETPPSKNRVRLFRENRISVTGLSPSQPVELQPETSVVVEIIVLGVGRWLSKDPIQEEGGINLYAYCFGDPVNSWDPLGLANCPKLKDNLRDKALLRYEMLNGTTNGFDEANQQSQALMDRTSDMAVDMTADAVKHAINPTGAVVGDLAKQVPGGKQVKEANSIKKKISENGWLLGLRKIATGTLSSFGIDWLTDKIKKSTKWPDPKPEEPPKQSECPCPESSAGK